MSEMRLCDTEGNRLYLNAEERRNFLAGAKAQKREVRAFCETLHWIGCCISEALEITPKRVDLSGGQIILRSLKKRRTSFISYFNRPPETGPVHHGLSRRARG